MRFFDADQTAALLPWQPLADAMLAAAAARRAGTVQAPERMVFPLAGDDRLLLMPAGNERHACVKLVSVNHHNPALGLPRVQGEVLLIDRASGRRLAMFDGVALTARRTAAVSLAAALACGRPKGGRLLIIGAGTQALAHATAFDAVLAPRRITITARSLDGAQRLVDRLAGSGIAARAASPGPHQVARADLIVTATTSHRPVLDDQVHDEAMVFAVGAFTPAMCELPASLAHRSQLLVDTLEGARSEAGDLIQAGVDWSLVGELGSDELHRLSRPGPLVFKSVGSALWDLAAAELAWAAAAR